MLKQNRKWPAVLSLLKRPGLFLVFLLPVLFSMSFSAVLSADELERILTRIQERYQSISSFSGSFVQVSFRSDADSEPVNAEGIVSYLRPGRMRWDYRLPEEQLMVTDGETLWLYDPLLENVTVQKLSRITEGTVLDFLLGAGDLRQDFRPRTLSRELLHNANGLIIELEPRKKLANLDFIQLEVHPETYDLKTLMMMDRQGNYRTISLNSMNYNLPLEPGTFVFEIPEGMEVLKAD